MHAASVHPEPGSNSRMFISYLAIRQVTISLSELFYLSFFYFLEYILLIDEICIFALAYALYFSLRCSIFNDRLLFLPDSLTIIPHTFPLVNTFFKTFLSFFIFGVFRQTMQQFDILSLSFCITKLRYYFLYKDE